MKHIENILEGFASILEIQSGGVRAYVMKNDGFAQDRKSIRDDVRTVGKDISGSTQKYGKPSRSSERHYQARR